MTKRSVLEIDSFCGWPKLIQICESFKNDRDRALPAILFQTGGRVSEVLQYSSKHFTVDGDFVVCTNLPLVKQKKIQPFRSSTFPVSEPLWKYSSKWIDQRKNKPLLFPYTRQWAYYQVAKCGVWNHWFRSQRASQIRLEYGLTGVELREWFKVRDLSWDQRYSKLGVEGLKNLIKQNIAKE